VTSKAWKEPKYWLISAIGIFLTGLTPFLGAPLLRIVRNVYGPFAFWIPAVLMTGALFAGSMGTMGLLMLSVWLAVGIFSEFEARGYGSFWPAMLAIAVATLVSWQGPVVLGSYMGPSVGPSLQESLKTLVERIESNPQQKEWLEIVGIAPQTLMGQVPSMLGIVFMMCLAMSLILARRISGLFGVRYEQIAGTGRLLDFRIPDALAIVLIVSFLFSFLNVKEPLVNIVALNVLQFLVGLYFFQGLCVLETAFLIFRVDPLIKIAVYILIVAQLFFLLSLIGLADFWLDFRTRMRNWKLRRNQNQGQKQ